jgi:Holliday junction resolvase RusA-like endonuclease
MPTVLNIFVRGLPKAQPRARHAGMAMVWVWREGREKLTTKPVEGDRLVYGRKLQVSNHVYNPDTADVWKAAIVRAVHAAWSVYTPDPITGHKGAGKLREPLDEPLVCDLTFYFPRPKYMLEKPFVYGADAIPYEVKPDTDNLDKAVKDAMTEADVWADDCRVYSGETSKWYSCIGGAPGVRIELETLARKPVETLFTAEAKS